MNKEIPEAFLKPKSTTPIYLSAIGSLVKDAEKYHEGCPVAEVNSLKSIITLAERRISTINTLEEIKKNSKI